uniref:SSD domain-containing protein n=1 Tax=Panagrellus redivivus TaxID=6233 RepID=A0A7E4VIM3_PANRE
MLEAINESSHPLPFIILPIVLTAVLSTSILGGHFEIIRGVHFLYAPLNAPWKAEEAIFRDLWANSDDKFYPGKDFLLRKGLYLIAEAADGGNILRPDVARDLISLLDWIRNSSFVEAKDQIPYSYSDICLRFQNECFANAQVRFLADIFARGDQKSFNVTFPRFRSEFSTEPIDISKVIGGVELDPVRGTVVGARNAIVLYQLKQESKLARDLSFDFELAVARQIDENKVPISKLKIYYYHSDTFDIELAEGTLQIVPVFTVTFLVLCTFAVLCTFNITWSRTSLKGAPVPLIDWVVSKPFLGIIGVVSALMAIVSATGLLLWMGVTFVDMCSVMPFLSLTIGIDDTFLMLASWHETSRRLSVEDRIEAAMRHAGVSITITSVTDALAFLIGAIAPLPAVIYFCYYSCAAICFIFLYSMTFFVAVMAVNGRWEEAGRHALMPWCETKDISNAENESKVACLFNLGSRLADTVGSETGSEPSVAEDNRLWYQRFFADRYAPFICHPVVQIAALLSFIGYVVVAYFGIQNMVVGFDLMNIVRPEAPPYRFLQLQTEYFLNDVSKLDIAVLKPPNMGSPTERSDFLKALTEIESTFCSRGRNSTDFWYFAYEKHVNQLGFGSFWTDLGEDAESFSDNLAPFLMAHEKYDYDILHGSNGTISAFRLTTQLANYGNDESILECARTIRGICAKYHAQFDIHTYTPLWNLADQFEIMWPQTLQDLYISILVMMPIALLLIPQPFCAVAIGVSIGSIGLGVVGFMTWWHVNLDATSMITIAMSVGFSVDFAAHCTYAYMTEANNHYNHEPSPYERMVAALSAVGWPITQGSLSVFLGITSLATVQTYVVETCFKTIFLVITFGMIHALLYLPLVLMHTHGLYLRFFGRKKSMDVSDVVAQ